MDACFGGWVLPYLRRLGADLPPFDFSVPGVTSVSVDLHKYAYAPKGVSVLLHRDETLRLPQYFAYADWPGYTMINPVISSTRSGGPIAAALAVLRSIGDAGYLDLAATTRDAVGVLAAAVEATDGLRLYAPAETTVVCLASDEVDLFVLADELAARGWHTQPQLAYRDMPPTIHLTVTAAVSATAAEFAPALQAAVVATRERGPVQLPPSLLRGGRFADARDGHAGADRRPGGRARPGRWCGRADGRGEHLAERRAAGPARGAAHRLSEHAPAAGRGAGRLTTCPVCQECSVNPSGSC